MDFVSTDGVAVVLTPGRYNSAFFEHAYLAEKTGAALAFPKTSWTTKTSLPAGNTASAWFLSGNISTRFAFNPIP